MKLNQIADRPGARKNRLRVGRGIGSGMGKTGGRGGKGQTARSGVAIKGFEGGQMPLHRRLPKRGFRNTSFQVKLNQINLGKVQAAIDAGLIDAGKAIDVETMVKAGLMRRAKGGVKLLGSGEFKSKAEFSVYRASKSAIDAVEKAGGSVKILAAVCLKQVRSDYQIGYSGLVLQRDEEKALRGSGTLPHDHDTRGFDP